MPSLNHTRTIRPSIKLPVGKPLCRSMTSTKKKKNAPPPLLLLHDHRRPAHDMAAADREWLRKTAPSGRLLPSPDTPVVATRSEWFATADGWMLALGPRVPLSNGQVASPTYIMCHTDEALVFSMLRRIRKLKRYAMLDYRRHGIWHAGTEITGLLDYFTMDGRFFCLYVTCNE
ncbi:hypothetical protein SYNPS1DRAFT_31910 [Syncephalis pseudoplumigaleata]|uniref:Uncharacterized protein n=1 Tax=Syncephalis pseudoplumigaleata TaxID=1712513 RepID=A0A4P9YRN1_9FUNG|nr:hypothetical protein SYNPS1DRAFT_31910 [Syncephalis pseudoplumigaleata]|eukprot:RKP22487.1 hypothetical protein SYNPS1DRAFT_31910 [Syncephalis pseudoplumigaleata]